MKNSNNKLSEENYDGISVIIAITVLIIIAVGYMYYIGYFENFIKQEPQTAQEALEEGYLDASENVEVDEEILNSLTAPSQ